MLFFPVAAAFPPPNSEQLAFLVHASVPIVVVPLTIMFVFSFTIAGAPFPPPYAEPLIVPLVM